MPATTQKTPLGELPLSYARCLSFMAARPTRHTATIANNTTLHAIPDPNSTVRMPVCFEVRLHGNTILTFYRSGMIDGTDANWPTQTTYRRLNQFGPVPCHKAYRRAYRYSPAADDVMPSCLIDKEPTGYTVNRYHYGYDLATGEADYTEDITPAGLKISRAARAAAEANGEYQNAPNIFEKIRAAKAAKLRTCAQAAAEAQQADDTPDLTVEIDGEDN